MHRILIADDNAGVLEALRILLKTEGFQTVLAESPRAVLEAVRTSRFDLILIDLNYARDTTSGREGLEPSASWNFIRATRASW
jgi:CheY-like chemotaxis protein